MEQAGYSECLGFFLSRLLNILSLKTDRKLWNRYYRKSITLSNYLNTKKAVSKKAYKIEAKKLWQYVTKCYSQKRLNRGKCSFPTINNHK